LHVIELTKLRIETESEMGNKKAIEIIKECFEEQISKSSFRELYVRTARKIMEDGIALKIANMIDHELALRFNDEQPSQEASVINHESSM
jgi:hypothetical protein